MNLFNITCSKIILILAFSAGLTSCGGAGLSSPDSSDTSVNRPMDRSAEQTQRPDVERRAGRPERPEPISPEERRTKRSEERGIERPLPDASDSGEIVSTAPTKNKPINIGGVKAPPKGIYHSAGVLVAGRGDSGLVTKDINSQDFISGTLVRVGWSKVNPSEGQFDFGIIANELAQAGRYNNSVSLAILDSNETPEYVLRACKNFSFTFRGTQKFRTCLPWDANYQKFKRELITELGEQFDNHPNLAGVYFTYAAMTNGVEMHWRVSEAEFKAAGYTPELLLKSYNTVMDMYAAAFKQTSVIMEVHTVFQDDYLAENAYEHCYDTLSKRCGVAIWWCSSRMATNSREAEYKVYPVAKKAVKQSFAVCQTVGNFSTSPDRFDSGQGWSTEKAFEHEMDFFIKEGFRNFELWSKDIKNPALVKRMKADVVTKIK